MPATVPAAGSRTESDAVELGLQRAAGIGLAAFGAQALAVAVTGWPLYPAWWYVGPGAAMAVAVVMTVVACLRGRSRRTGRLVAVATVSAAVVATAVATAGTVQVVGNAASAVVTAFAILVGLFEPPAVALPAGAVMIACLMVGVSVTRPLPVDDVAVVTAIQSGMLLAGTAARRVLHRSAAELDAARDRLARAIGEDRVVAATRRDRREQERRLHDTVLSTLTALARSSLTGSATLRERCAADARYLRGLHEQGDERPGDLVDALRALARSRTAPGFAVHVAPADLAGCPPVPPAVVDALVRAAAEGVENAFRHSGAGSVEIAARARGGGLTVEVTDRGSGAGALSSSSPSGLGITRSVVERMADAGGHGRVEHVAGRGTRVVLTWPR